MRQALSVMRQVLCSLPVAVLLVLTMGFLWLGWGTKQVDKFIIHWNNMTEDDS